jgi:site-specific DNA-methyltransferase (adenine-specific)
MESTRVFDPFCGSGTTGVAALRLGRNFIGCDLEEEYLSKALLRLNDECSATGMGTPSLFEQRVAV